MVDTSPISDYNSIYGPTSPISDSNILKSRPTQHIAAYKNSKRSTNMMPELHPGMKEFNRIFKECNRIYHDIALKLELSDSGFDILYTLCDIGNGCLQKDICDATMLSKQTIHSSVQKLAKDGYLSLQPGKGRDLHIHLTPAGKALMEEKIAPAIQIENLAFTDMTDDEQAEFLRLNRKYADSLRKHAAQL